MSPRGCFSIPYVRLVVFWLMLDANKQQFSSSFEMYDKLETGLYEQQVSGSNVGFFSNG